MRFLRVRRAADRERLADSEATPFAKSAHYLDLSSMGGTDRLHDGKPESGTPLLTGPDASTR